MTFSELVDQAKSVSLPIKNSVCDGIILVSGHDNASVYLNKIDSTLASQIGTGIESANDTYIQLLADIVTAEGQSPQDTADIVAATKTFLDNVGLITPSDWYGCLGPDFPIT